MPDDAVALFDLPHRRARALVETGVPVFLGVDPVEYHGPHLSLHNDRLISRGLARDVHARIAPGQPFVFAENLEAGFEPTPGRGSRDVGYAALTELVVSACQALAELGAKRLVVMTFHGSPLHSLALQRGVEAFRARGGLALAPMNVLLRDLLTLDPAIYLPALSHVPEADRAAMMPSLNLDFHAGFGETSLALHYAPHSVDACHRELPDCPELACPPAFVRASRVAERAGRVELAREIRFAGCGLAWSKLRPFPGYTSRPRFASADAGAFIARDIVGRIAGACEAVFAGGPPPRPVMAWMERLTLGGRVPGMHVPLDAVAAFDAAFA